MKYPVFIAAAATLALLHTSSARADVPGKADIIRVVDDGTQALSAFIAGPNAASQAGHLGARPEADRPPTSTPEAKPVNPDARFLPRPSLLLRDWRESFVVAGAPALLVDDIRPFATNRVALARLTAPAIETKRATLSVSPFAQVGAGEWRIDPVLIPAMPIASTYAGQIGGGLEITIARQVHIAAEGQTTYLYGAQPWSGNVTMPRVLSGVVALQARF